MSAKKYHSFNHSLKLSKEKLYEANVRNGFYMWDYKSSMNTVQNIISVKDGKIFVPKFEDVRLGPCPKPPLKSFVISEVLNELSETFKRRTEMLEQVRKGEIIQTKEQIQELERCLYLPITKKQSPDLQWLLNVLSTLNPKHAFFHKSYYPSNEQLGGRGKPVNDSIEEQDHFFKDLPKHISKSKAINRGNCTFNDQSSISNLHSIFQSQTNPVSKQQEIEKLKNIIDELNTKIYKNADPIHILKKRRFNFKQNNANPQFSEQMNSNQLKDSNQRKSNLKANSSDSNQPLQIDKIQIRTNERNQNSQIQNVSNLFVPSSLSLAQTFASQQTQNTMHHQPFYNFKSQNYISPTKVQLFEMRQFQIIQDHVQTEHSNQGQEMLSQLIFKSNEKMHSVSKNNNDISFDECESISSKSDAF